MRSHAFALYDQLVIDRAFGGRFQNKEGWKFLGQDGGNTAPFRLGLVVDDRAGELRLRESESFHRLIGELASDFAFHARIELDNQVVIDSATSGLQAILGYTLDDLRNRPGLSLIHPEDRAYIQEELSRAGAGDAEWLQADRRSRKRRT